MLREIIARVNPVRRLRSFPRVVKRKMSNFPVKRAHHRDWPQPAPADHDITITKASKTHPTPRSPRKTPTTPP